MKSMEERLVDVLNEKNNLLHVFPVKMDARAAPPRDADFEQKAIKAAVASEIVPPSDAGKLKARPHISRGGPVAPYGDALQTKHEQYIRLQQRIRDRGYFLWREDGCPDGRADEYWYRACEIEGASAA
jgi:hypothetical protein